MQDVGCLSWEMGCIGSPLLVFTGIRVAFLRYGWMEGLIAEDYWLVFGSD